MLTMSCIESSRLWLYGAMIHKTFAFVDMYNQTTLALAIINLALKFYVTFKKKTARKSKESITILSELKTPPAM